MPTQVERRTLQRAMEFHGGADGLAPLLDTSADQIRRWSDGAEPVPPSVFMQVVDLVIEHDVAELRRHPSTPNSERPESMAEAASAGLRYRLRAVPATRNSPAQVPIVHPFFAADFAPRDIKQLLSTALDAALKVAGTDLGNIQFLDRGASLRIEAQRGFTRPFLAFFDMVRIGDACACGKALREQQQVFVEDVQTDPLFAGTVSAGVLLEAGVIALASSPVIDADGAAVGVVSTHYRRRVSPQAANLDAQQMLADRLGQWLERDMHYQG